MQAAATPGKKSKTKKHKKERRRKRRSSTSSSEDQGKEDRRRRRHRGSHRDKNRHVSSESSNCPRWNSPREIGSKTGMYKKSDGQSIKSKSEMKKDSHGREHKALHSSVKHSSSQHYTSTSTKSSSGRIPEAPTNERTRKRRSSSEEPGKTTAEAEERRKKKRRASKEDDNPVAKRRSSKEQSDVGSRERKDLVEKQYRKSNEEQKHSSHEKSQSQHSSKESKHPASAVTQNARPKTQNKGHSESIDPPTSRDKSISSPPSLPITFKIPKKSSVVKIQTRTSTWFTNVPKSFITKKCSPKTMDSPIVKVTPEHPSPSPTEVPSPVPTVSPTVQLAQSSRTEETSAPSSRNALVKHTRSSDVSTESTETTDDDYEMQIVEELHQARSNRQLHVNLEMSSGELTSMDVDQEDEGTTVALSQKQQQQQDLLIVLDTNILLSHLDFVKKIRTRGLGALGFPTLLVPWVVLQELDSLKSGKLSKNVESKARPAVDYIYTSLKNQEPRLWGQSMQQVTVAARGLNTVNNDDRVLQCCLQYKALYPEGTVMLCTNDKNLCSKALLSGVQALSKADLQEQAEVNSEHFLQHYGQTDAYPHEALIKQHQQEKGQSEDVEARRKKETERELSECVSVIESSLQSALSAVLEEEMKAAFGELWLEIVYVKPPWSLDALLQCFRKHWIAVFGVIIRRSLISCVETLSSFIHTDASVEHSSVLDAVSVSEELLTALRSRSSYSGHVDSTLSCLKTLRHRLQPKPQKSSVDDRGGDTLMADAVQDVASSPQASHQDVWALFESIWNNVCHVSSAVFSALHFSPGPVCSVEPQSMPPPQDALSCLHRLIAALEQLLEAFQRLLSVDSNVEDAQALLTFIQSSEIAAMEPHFSAKDLFECLSHQEYREKLCIGGAQLMELRENLRRCAAATCSTNGGHT